MGASVAAAAALIEDETIDSSILYRLLKPTDGKFHCRADALHSKRFHCFPSVWTYCKVAVAMFGRGTGLEFNLFEPCQAVISVTVSEWLPRSSNGGLRIA